MNTPQFGIPVVIGYGNGASTISSPPMIDHTVYANGPTNFHAPSLTTQPKMPIIEKITPANVNATQVLQNVRQKLLDKGVMGGATAIDNVLANIRSIRLRVSSNINRNIPNPRPLTLPRHVTGGPIPLLK